MPVPALNITKLNGVKIYWCPRRDSNPRPQDSSHYDFHRHWWLLLPPSVCKLDCLFTLGYKSLRHYPYSLYTFLSKISLARDWHDTEYRSVPRIRVDSPYCFQLRCPILGILCSILLSYADTVSLLPCLYPFEKRPSIFNTVFLS